jgi:transposase-like protein
MSIKRRGFSNDFKLQVLSEADQGVSISELKRRYELSGGMIAKWRRQLKQTPANPFPGKGSRNTDKAKIAEMERLIGRQALEIDFLKNLLKRLKEAEM